MGTSINTSKHGKTNCSPYYHVALSEYRAQIETGGLRSDEGVHLWSALEHAQDMASDMEEQGETVDIYQVNADGLVLHEDHNYKNTGFAYYTLAIVGSELISRLNNLPPKTSN
jgi:hypothetical protein